MSYERIGIIVPSENTVMETDFHRCLNTSDITVHTSRLRWYKGKAVSSIEILKRMNWKDLDTAVLQLTDAKVSFIIYGCTSGSFVGGKSWDEQIIRHIREVGSVDSTTTSSAIVAALDHLHLRRLSVVTPYPDEVNRMLVKYLAENGKETVSLATFNEPDMLKHAEIPPDSIKKLAKTVIKPDTEGILIACTQLRALEVASEIEEELGYPVVTAVQASIWAALQYTRKKVNCPKGGSLLSYKKINGGV